VETEGKDSRLEKDPLWFGNTMLPDFPSPPIKSAFRQHRPDGEIRDFIGGRVFFTPEEFNTADHIFEGKFDEFGQFSGTVKILNRSDGGRVGEIKVGNLTLRGRNIRDICELRSANFTISFHGNNIIFITDGYGHGVGMSQWGANGMAQAGYNYKEILSHYYSGIEIK